VYNKRNTTHNARWNHTKWPFTLHFTAHISAVIFADNPDEDEERTASFSLERYRIESCNARKSSAPSLRVFSYLPPLSFLTIPFSFPVNLALHSSCNSSCFSSTLPSGATARRVFTLQPIFDPLVHPGVNVTPLLTAQTLHPTHVDSQPYNHKMRKKRRSGGCSLTNTWSQD
jgi:hypothetical protein